MKRIFTGKRSILNAALALSIILAVFAGCSGSSSNWLSEGFSDSESNTAPTSRYYDFGDVLVPSELSVDDDATYVIESAGMRTGVMTLSGRVEKTSLVNFFKTGMVKDGWTAIASFRTPKRSILLFQKVNRWCVINILDHTMTTEVEIGVVPSMNDQGGVTPMTFTDDPQIEESGLAK